MTDFSVCLFLFTLVHRPVLLSNEMGLSERVSIRFWSSFPLGDWSCFTSDVSIFSLELKSPVIMVWVFCECVIICVFSMLYSLWAFSLVTLSWAP